MNLIYIQNNIIHNYILRNYVNIELWTSYTVQQQILINYITIRFAMTFLNHVPGIE